ncbi:MAG TPA: RluA family pseudouridine synthase [Halanaerobiaceae bacterium]|jgi:23S rRNA pseudouridine1911/1915/1917 synthase|nr:RluA family pseudouridine synthase [Halanaerobiaceae bacterium]
MKEANFLVQEIEQGERLDKFLSSKYKDLSRSYIQKLIMENMVTVNGRSGKANYKVKRDDLIKVIIPEARTPEIKAVEMELEIIYEDESILVVNKAPGLLVHPVPGQEENTLVNALLAYSDSLSGINGVKRPGIVHRLDKDTSGAIVVAKNDLSHRKLVEEFKERDVLKIYHTIVKGNLPHNEGVIDAPIGRDPRERKKMAVTDRNSKEAISHFKVLDRFENYTYLEVKLETGRTHQIRVHLSYLGYPILGDEKYGRSKKNKLPVQRQLLHAYILGFKHPLSGEWMEFKAPLPEDFKSVLKILKKT